MFGVTNQPPAGDLLLPVSQGDEVAKDIVQELAKLEQELTSKRQSAIQAILDEKKAKNKEWDDQLRALGFDTPTGKAKKATGKRSVSDEPCKICGYRTSPPHDSRSHRGQSGKTKQPFTKAELDERGLTKVAKES